MSQHFIFVDGAPGSGKTTWIRRHPMFAGTNHRVLAIPDEMTAEELFEIIRSENTNVVFIELHTAPTNILYELVEMGHRVNHVVCGGAALNYSATETNLNEPVMSVEDHILWAIDLMELTRAQNPSSEG
jgi:hypothetical protein